MPSMTADSVHIEEVRAELHSILQSQSFVRSPGLSRLLSYLCEKVLSGESGQIKEYSVALDVFGRQDSFDQDSDSIVRVQANRLRKRLAEYYATEGKEHKLHITIRSARMCRCLKNTELWRLQFLILGWRSRGRLTITNGDPGFWLLRGCASSQRQ